MRYDLPPSRQFQEALYKKSLLAHGCPLQAIVVAFGYDERTVAG